MSATSINTNINSLVAQQNLQNTANSMSTSMARLSSGLRINSAADDAAGLAISQRMTTQISGLNQASNNANNGISLAQTADGALGQIGNMLQSMRQLAVEAENATNSTADRASLQQQITQLQQEVDRTAKETNFNGQQLLDGSFTGSVFQVGANAGQTITVGGLGNETAKGLGQTAYAYDNSQSNISTGALSSLGSIAAGTLSISVAGATSAISLGALAAAGTAQQRLGDVVQDINNSSADTGVSAFLSQNANGSYSVNLVSSSQTSAGNAAQVTLSGFSASSTGITSLASFATALSATSTTTDAIGIDTLDVTSQSGAWVALQKITSAINAVDTARGTLGAVENRFNAAISNIGTMSDNLQAANGRIVDANYAQETANLSRTQVLQQAGIAMVAQANQHPQQILSLLK
ncbi:MAG: flagellin [Curvibacter sp.]|nr:flagellin [Curvibacter sp.]